MTTTRRAIVLGAVAGAVVLAANAVLSMPRNSTYFYTDGRTELGLPVPKPEPVLLGIHLLQPAAGDTVEVKAIRARMTEGSVAPRTLLYDPAGTTRLVGMIVESERTSDNRATFSPPTTAGAFGADDPRQVVLRLLPGDAEVTIGPVDVDFVVNGGAVQTQVFEVYARACFAQPHEYDCRPPTAGP